jgi:UDP-GlcNAc:undecaprenyl-phosphate GlcNAc-1-phosphate transferase
LFIAFWTVFLLIGWFWPDRVADLRPQALPIFAGAVIVLILGIVDDLRPLQGYAKLVAQMAAFAPLWLSGIGFDRLWIPFIGGLDLGLWSLPVSMLWFLTLVNAVNVIDGVDGLATATSALVALTLIWITWTLNLTSLTIVGAVLFGSLAGFWRYNRPPASVFMGDSGALFLGYVFAVIALLAPIKRFTALAFFVPLIAMLLPLAESAISVTRRVISGRNPIRADVGHLHHMLLSAGWTAGQVVAAYAIVTGICGAFCIGFHYMNRRILTVALGFFVLLLGVALAIFLRRSRAGMGGQDGAQPADEE